MGSGSETERVPAHCPQPVNEMEDAALNFTAAPWAPSPKPRQASWVSLLGAQTWERGETPGSALQEKSVCLSLGWGQRNIYSGATVQAESWKAAC